MTPNRILIVGNNSTMSRTAVQDAVRDSKGKKS